MAISSLGPAPFSNIKVQHQYIWTTGNENWLSQDWYLLRWNLIVSAKLRCFISYSFRYYSVSFYSCQFNLFDLTFFFKSPPFHTTISYSPHLVIISFYLYGSNVNVNEWRSVCVSIVNIFAYSPPFCNQWSNLTRCFMIVLLTIV